MKKILFGLLCTIMTFAFVTTAKAASEFKISLTGDNTFKEQITLYVEISEFANVSGSCGGVCKASFNISYDLNRLALIGIEGINDFQLNDQVASTSVVRNRGVTTKTNMLKLIFENIGLKEGEKTTVKIVDATVNVGSGLDYNVKEAEKVIQNIGKTVENSDLPSGGGSGETTLSQNNYLSSITIDHGALAFSRETTHYQIQVDASVASVTVAAKPEDNKAKITGDGVYSLNEDTTTITIQVTAENGNKKDYTLVFTKIKTEEDPGTTDPNQPSEDPGTNPTPGDKEDENPSKQPETKKSNIVLYSIIGGVVIIILAVVTVIVIKKRKTTEN